MRPHDQPAGLCSVDPITATTLAIGALAGGGVAAATSSGGGGSTPAPAPTPTAPPPAQQPQGTAKANKAAQSSTFLGAAATPPTQSGQKSLLGQ